MNMNQINQNIEELQLLDMRVSFDNKKFEVHVTRKNGPSVQGFGDDLAEALRDAVEQARLGNFVTRIIQAGEHVHVATITMQDEGVLLVEKKRFVAKNDAHAKLLAELAFNDRPGFTNVTVAFVETVGKAA